MLYASPSPLYLLKESKAILDAIHDPVGLGTLGIRARHYLTASLMDSDMLGDERRLALVRSEMLHKLAMAVALQARPFADAFEHCQKGGGGRRQHEALMRKYALLSEFVHMSDAYFGTARVTVTDTGIIDELDVCKQKRRPLLQAVVRDLYDYGSSITLIVDHLVPREGGAEVNPGTIDLSAMHERLTVITEEIFKAEPLVQ
jgi:hypothetical protein